MKLVIFHYHFRPGGIRRVIELATPYLVRRLELSSLLLVTGEAPDSNWRELFCRQTAPVPVELVVDRAFSYVSEQRSGPRKIEHRIWMRLGNLLDRVRNSGGLVWAHNLGIARNLLLTRELVRSCAERDLPLVAHHHDWWFENRWLRWPEMRRCGFRTLRATANALFPSTPVLRHVTINQNDAALLQRHFPKRSFWLPNVAERTTPPPSARVRSARVWLSRAVQAGDAPVWILPCRLLRRKNLAEAILLTRWLRPEAWLVTTGGASSADELEYACRLEQAIHDNGWQVRLALLREDEQRAPRVSELIEASETILLTSLQEGFGLPYLEASVASKPLIARALPNIVPDLKRLGFRFPQMYGEIFVATDLFDSKAELKRQQRLFRGWCKQLPTVCRNWVGKPAFLDSPENSAVPFSRLTLTAQLEVLERPVTESWDACSRLNPFLTNWKRSAARAQLRPAPWPQNADKWLSGPAYAEQFAAIATSRIPDILRDDGEAVQNDFLRQRLSAEYLFPLLWQR